MTGNRRSAGVLLEGDEPRLVHGETMARYEALASEQVAFAPVIGGDLAVEALVRAHIAGESRFRLIDGYHALVARSSAGAVTGAVVVVRRRDMRAVQVSHLVVEPRMRDRGIGAVLIGLAAQVNPWAMFLFGGCAPEDARFYQRCGFTVLAEGSPLTIDNIALPNTNRHHPCWFYRPNYFHTQTHRNPRHP